MNSEEIVVTIDKDGNVSISVSGVAGSSCEQLTADLIHKLGGEILEHQTTDDYYRISEEVVNDQRTGH